jgi:uncharacterized protein DUF6755
MGPRSQGTTIFTAIFFLVATCMVLQLWLLTLATTALLSGETTTVIAAAGGSTVLLLINAGLLRYVYRVDRDVDTGE